MSVIQSGEPPRAVACRHITEVAITDTAPQSFFQIAEQTRDIRPAECLRGQQGAPAVSKVLKLNPEHNTGLARVCELSASAGNGLPAYNRSCIYLHRCTVIKFWKHFGTCARNATFEKSGAVRRRISCSPQRYPKGTERRQCDTLLRFVEIGLSQARTPVRIA